MTDVFSTTKRSEIMSRIKGRKNEATEQRLIAIMKECGLRGWRRQTTLFGKPDFVFPKNRLAVFVDGCFWYSCPKHRTLPTTNAAFWAAKFERNLRRDKLVNKALKKAGWRVARVWQHELKDGSRVAKRLFRLIAKQPTGAKS